MSIDNEILSRISQISVIDEHSVIAHGPHAPGSFKGTRLFGGQTITQGYLAFKILHPMTQVVKLDTIFIAPGSITIPLKYTVDEKTLQFGFAKITVTQDEKIIASCMIRFSRNLSSLLLIDSSNFMFPANVGPPDNYESITIRSRTGMFEIRFIGDFFEEDKRTEDVDLFQCWARLNPDFVIPNYKNAVTPLLLLTDYIVNRPVVNLYRHYDKSDEAQTGASLNHKIIFHHTDNMNPKGFFLVQNRSHIISRQCGMIEGQIFDENRKCILSYRQENFLQK